MSFSKCTDVCHFVRTNYVLGLSPDPSMSKLQDVIMLVCNLQLQLFGDRFEKLSVPFEHIF